MKNFNTKFGDKFGFVKRAFNALRDLIKNCGLISFNTPFEDKVGKTSRQTVRGLALVGDGNTYYDTKIVPNQNTILRIWGNFNVLGLSERIGGSQSTDRFYIGKNSGNQWLFGWNNFFVGGIADTLKHKFELKNGEGFVDDVKIGGTQGEVLNPINFSIFLLALNNNGGPLNNSNFTLDRCEIEHNGVTYTLNIPMRQSDGIIELLGSDGSKIEGEQFISPANPTVLSLQESQQDKLGVTFADGVTLFRDEALTQLYDVDTPVLTNYGWVSDGMGGSKKNTVEFNGAIKKNFEQTDGVSYSGKNNINWQFVGIGTGTDGVNITLVEDAGNDRAKLYGMPLKPNTEYTAVYNVSDVTTTNFIMIAIESDIPLNLTARPTVIGENRYTFTTDSTITFGGVSFVVTNGHVTFDTFRVYEGDYVTGSPPLPTSGVYGPNNSKILDQPYDGIGEYDTNRILTDATHEPKVITFDDSWNVDNNQFYQSLDKQKSLFFKEPLTEPCYAKAMKFVDLVEGLEDSEGSPLFDSENDRLYALKEGVVIK